MADATLETIEAALFAALESLRVSATPSGPFVVVDRYAGEVTVAGIEAAILGKSPSALLAFEGSAPIGGEGAFVDTILHDIEIVERAVWRIYVSVLDTRSVAAAQNGTIGQPGVLRCARHVKKALVGLRIPGLHAGDLVRLTEHKPWSIKRGAHIAHLIRVSTLSRVDLVETAAPPGAVPLEEMHGENGPPDNTSLDRSTILFP
jgi:hypothetical protein